MARPCVAPADVVHASSRDLPPCRRVLVRTAVWAARAPLTGGPAGELIHSMAWRSMGARKARAAALQCAGWRTQKHTHAYFFNTITMSPHRAQRGDRATSWLVGSSQRVTSATLNGIVPTTLDGQCHSISKNCSARPFQQTRPRGSAIWPTRCVRRDIRIQC